MYFWTLFRFNFIASKIIQPVQVGILHIEDFIADEFYITTEISTPINHIALKSNWTPAIFIPRDSHKHTCENFTGTCFRL